MAQYADWEGDYFLATKVFPSGATWLIFGQKNFVWKFIASFNELQIGIGFLPSPPHTFASTSKESFNLRKVSN